METKGKKMSKADKACWWVLGIASGYIFGRIAVSFIFNI